MSDIHEQIQSATEQERNAIIANVLGASRAPSDEVELNTEFDLIHPLDVKTTPSATLPVRITRIRVLKRVFPLATPGTEDAEPWYEARGYGRPLTKKGTVHSTANATWFFLPSEVAEQLLGHVTPSL